ncbi:MAG: hypothetical protein ACLP53_28525 [Isosphaeraceae bacterium]
MTTEIQAEANRRNALQSTGPKTGEGIEAARFNALRHGLRALQTVVPGEAPEEWEAHRIGVVEDLKPGGAVELALAEQIAAKLWRLGRVVRHEADVIAIGLDPAELAHFHEEAFTRTSYSFTLKPTDIPTYKEVREAATAVRTAKQKARKLETAIRQIDALPSMNETDSFPGWDLYESLRDTLHLKEEELAEVFEGEEEGALEVRNVRDMLAVRGKPEEGLTVVADIWRKQKAQAEAEGQKAVRKHKNLKCRYEAAIERLRRSRGLPDEAVLDKIQRYEAHLERGLHKALERLQTLQEARGAVPIEPQGGGGPGGHPDLPRGRRNGFVRQFCQ